jgi:uncharacterized membrane protein
MMNPRHLDLLWKAVAYLSLYSFLGWILDTAYRSSLTGTWTSISSIDTVLAPVYGFGALAFLSLRPLFNNKHPLIQWVLLALAGGLVEYVGGWVAITYTGDRLWDYSDTFLNIHGHTDLFHIIIWGLLGLFFLRVIHPVVERHLF